MKPDASKLQGALFAPMSSEDAVKQAISGAISAENGSKSAENGQKSPENEPNLGELERNLSIHSIEIGNEFEDLYRSAKSLLEDVLNDESVPANQRAQVLNSVSSLAQQIAKTRSEIFTSERLRKLEQALIRTLKRFPQELQTQFLEDYERSLAESDVS